MTLGRVPLVMLVLVGCTPQAPVDDGVCLWNLTSGSLEFGACTDSPWFRSFIQVPPLTTDAGPAYIAYIYAADRKTAEAAECTNDDARSCEEKPGGVTLQVIGNQLTYTDSFSVALGDGGCRLNFDRSDVLTEEDRRLSADETIVLTLTEVATGACVDAEAIERASSPNGLGLEGCVAVLHLAAERR